MEFVELLNAMKDFGPPGMLLSFMVWDRMTQNTINKERIKADIAMASGITALTDEIRRGRN